MGPALPFQAGGAHRAPEPDALHAHALGPPGLEVDVGRQPIEFALDAMASGIHLELIRIEYPKIPTARPARRRAIPGIANKLE